MIRPLPLLRLAFCCALVCSSVYLTGCDSTDAQDEFEDRAFSGSFEGITSTTSDGEVVDEDEDDWQVAPLYVNTVAVRPAYPNPTAGQLVTIEINVLFGDAIRGQLGLYGFTDSQPRRLRLIDTLPGSTEPGFYSLLFSPTALSQEPGLRRFFIFDGSTGRDRLVTYGDVMLE